MKQKQNQIRIIWNKVYESLDYQLNSKHVENWLDNSYIFNPSAETLTQILQV